LHEFGSLRHQTQTVRIVGEPVTIPALISESRTGLRKTTAEPEALPTVENTLNRQFFSVVVLLILMIFLFALLGVNVEPKKMR
jgi:hypothetical protein